jgi:hypothetical protein
MLVDAPRQHAAATSLPSSRCRQRRRRPRMFKHALSLTRPAPGRADETRVRPGVIGPPNRRTSTMPPAGRASTKASIPRKRTWWALPSVSANLAESVADAIRFPAVARKPKLRWAISFQIEASMARRGRGGFARKRPCRGLWTER